MHLQFDIQQLIRVTACVFLVCLFSFNVSAQQKSNTENIFLITYDGLRWEELFTGADKKLIQNEDYVENGLRLAALFWDDNPNKRRERLLPFFWNTIAVKGQLYGNRLTGCTVDVTNNQWFSYPGYNEILVGYDDPNITSNAKIPNPNKTVLEILNEQDEFNGKVAAFGSWDVFPYIINEERSGYR